MTERQAEGAAYVVAVVILVVGGACLQSVILNWICGPAIVIASVAVVPRLLTRSRERERR